MAVAVAAAAGVVARLACSCAAAACSMCVFCSISACISACRRARACTARATSSACSTSDAIMPLLLLLLAMLGGEIQLSIAVCGLAVCDSFSDDATRHRVETDASERCECRSIRSVRGGLAADQCTVLSRSFS